MVRGSNFRAKSPAHALRSRGPYVGFLQSLDKTWQDLIRNSVASNTSKQYASGQRKFLDFCNLIGAAPCPASEVLLMRYVASISNSVRGSTVQSHLSAIRFLHIANGFPNPMESYERLKLMVRALKKRSGNIRQRAPVTVVMLEGIFRCLNFQLFNDSLLWAMIACAFFGFLRVSEFTTEGDFDPNFNLELKDFSIERDLSFASLRIKSSKTDPFRKGCTITLGAISDPKLCPVAAMIAYLRRRGLASGPLFRSSNGRPASRSWFCRRLKESIAIIGVTGDFTSHSLRIGAATAAAAAGLSAETIQAMGRWSSDAFKIYIRRSDDSKKRVSQVLASA